MVPEGGKQKGKLDRGNLGATPNPDESSRRNLNSSKSNIYKSTTPNPSVAPTGAGEGTMQPVERGQGQDEAGEGEDRETDEARAPNQSFEVWTVANRAQQAQAELAPVQRWDW